MLSTILYLSFLYTLFLQVYALPTSPEKRGVPSSQVSQFALYEQYAAAAYCKDNNDDSTGTLSCQAGNCPQVQQAGARSVLEFSDLGLTDATGFVAVDDQNKLIVLAYRGTSSIGNWIGNVDVGFQSFGVCSGCQVHGGFLSSWTDSRDQVTAALTQAKADNPSYQIIFTGHSLGAAIATLAAADLRQQGFNAALYTYGSPMVGNDKFANFVTNQSGGNFRVTHANDAVPKLPGYILSYRHVSPEYWVTTPSNKQVNAGDIKVSSGILNLWGNQGTFLANIADHMWYFNAISACSGGFQI